jgi:phenylpropionate dioxygenase-like ring-hydroxylating dioxygenase large terminal subunit
MQFPPTTRPSSVSPLNELLQEIQATAERPLTQAISLPAAAYTSPEFYEWEVAQIFKREWLCVGHSSQIPNAGDYFTLNLCDEPLLVTRGRDQQVRVLSRVCPHRGMELLPPDYGHPRQGNRQNFLCAYHHWCFGLEGKLVGAPQMQNSETFDADKLGLHPFRTEVWQGFILLSFNPDSTELPPPAAYFAGLQSYLERWQIGKMQMVANLEWDCNFNWKIMVENFMEPYHHIGTHSITLEPLMPAVGAIIAPETPPYMATHVPFISMEQANNSKGNKDLNFSIVPLFPVSPLLQEQDFRQASVYLGEPDFLIFVLPDRIYLYILVPLGPNQTRLYTTILTNAPSPDSDAPDSEDYAAKIEKEVEALKEFHLEDMEVCTAMQRGLHSATYRPGPLSHLEKSVWLFQRYLARRICAQT